MPTINYKELATVLDTILKNIIPAENVNQSEPHRLFGGDETSISIAIPGSAPLHAVADPNVNLGKSFAINSIGLEAYESIFEGLVSDEAIKSKVGRGAVENEIDALLRSLRGNTGLTEDELKNRLKDSVKNLVGLVKSWVTIVPVDNLELIELTEFVVGRVKFLPASFVMPKVLTDANTTLDASSSPINAKNESKQMIWGVVAQHFGTTKTCAEISLEGEASRLPALADNEVDASLNLLRCYTNFIFPADHRAFIGLRGDVVAAYRPCISQSSDGNDWKYNIQSVGPLSSYTINSHLIERLTNHFGFKQVSDALAKSSPTKYEQVILVTSRWLGRGVVARDSAEKVLNLSVALERLICGDKREGITDTLAQRIAFVLGDSAEARTHIYKRMKKLYGLRSKVVHEGSTDVAAQDLAELEQYACTAFIKMCLRLNEWKDPVEFFAWTEAQMFSVPVPPAISEETKPGDEGSPEVASSEKTDGEKEA